MTSLRMNLCLGVLILCAMVTTPGCKSKSSDKSVNIDVDKILASAPRIPIGHKVRIRTTPVTQTAGFSGKVGNLSGFTMPSSTKIEVIGEATHDIAFGVKFKDRDEAYWFPPELLEFIDRTSNLEIDIYGKRWTWRTDGTLEKMPK